MWVMFRKEKKNIIDLRSRRVYFLIQVFACARAAGFIVFDQHAEVFAA